MEDYTYCDIEMKGFVFLPLSPDEDIVQLLEKFLLQDQKWHNILHLIL